MQIRFKANYWHKPSLDHIFTIKLRIPSPVARILRDLDNHPKSNR